MELLLAALVIITLLLLAAQQKRPAKPAHAPVYARRNPQRRPPQP